MTTYPDNSPPEQFPTVYSCWSWSLNSIYCPPPPPGSATIWTSFVTGKQQKCKIINSALHFNFFIIYIHIVYSDLPFVLLYCINYDELKTEIALIFFSSNLLCFPCPNRLRHHLSKFPRSQRDFQAQYKLRRSWYWREEGLVHCIWWRPSAYSREKCWLLETGTSGGICGSGRINPERTGQDQTLPLLC